MPESVEVPGQPIRRGKVDQWVPGTGRTGAGELVLNGHRVSVWVDEKVLETDGGVAAQQCEMCS